MSVANRGVAAAAPLCFRLPAMAESGAIAVSPSANLALPKLPAISWTTGDALMLRLPMAVAEVGVTTAELEQLGVGDVVVLPGATPQSVAEVQLAISPGASIIARIDGRKLTVAGVGKSMSPNDAATGAKPAPATKPAAPTAKPAAAAAPEPVMAAAAIEELPLRIVFEMSC